MIETPIAISIGAWLGLIVAVGLFIYLYKKHIEGNILKGTIDLINKLDSLQENIEGGNMEDIKKLAKYIGKKIDNLGEELGEKIEALEMSILEQAEEKEAEEEGTFEDLEDDYEGPRKVKTKEEEAEEEPEEAEEFDFEEEEKPKKKKGKK